MLYRKYVEDRWNYTEWRYFCECSAPDHVLCFTIDEEEDRLDLDISINSNDGWSIWRRIKEALRLLFGGEVVYLGVMINKDDRKELAAILSGEKT